MTLFIEFLILYQIWKLTKFNFLFKLQCLYADYYKNIIKRPNSVAFKEILKFNIIELVYIFITVMGQFTINYIFFLGVISASFMQTILFKVIKNKRIKKIIFFLVILLSLMFLVLSLLNNYIFKSDSLLLIKKFLNI
jgi:hypothetical protein